MKFSVFGFMIILLIGLVLALSITNFNQPFAFVQPASAGMIMVQQTTSAPIVQDVSEIGSTDGIFVMGIVIVMIVILPLWLRKK